MLNSMFDKFLNLLSSVNFGYLNGCQLHQEAALSNYFGHNKNWMVRNSVAIPHDLWCTPSSWKFQIGL